MNIRNLMTITAAREGKPYAGNPHVRFVASAATPRRWSLFYKKLVRMFCAAFSSVACVATAAEKLVSQETMKAIYEEVKTPHKVGMVMLPGKGEKIDNPCVFRHGDAWYMIFVVFDGKGYETHLAKSDDLVRWKRLGKVFGRAEGDCWDSAQADGWPLLLDPRWEGPNTLCKFDGRYWMMYIGGHNKGYETDPLSTGVAWTDDPSAVKQWTRYPKNPVLSPSDADARDFERKTIFKHYTVEDPTRACGGRFVNLYNAKQKGVWRETIGMAVSDDMLNWRRVGDGPVISDGNPAKFAISGDPMIRRIGDVWVMFYFGCGWKRSGAFDTFACSYDLKHWTKWEGKPLIEPSEPYDATYAHKPWVIKHNGVVYHFYCAVGDKGRGIALATSSAQSAFVCQYDGMNETNRVEVKSVKVSGPNRTLTWTADRDYPQCGVGFEFVATNWCTNNYVFAPAAIYDGNRFDIAYIGYAPYITNWEMPKKPNRPVVTTNIHHLNKNGTDARIDFLAGETSAPMVGYWDSVKKEGHLYLADPTTPLGETGFSVRESPKNKTCTFVLSAPGIRTTKYTMCRSRRQDCGDRAPDVKKGTTVTFGVTVVDFKAKDIDAFLARAFDVRKLRTGRTVHAKVADPETVIQQILANEDAHHWYEDTAKGLGYYCNQPNGNSPFGHLQLGWNGVPVYLLPLLERPTPERLRRCAVCWDAISKMNGKSGLYYAINRRGELLGDSFRHMTKLRDHAMMRRTAITIYYGIQSLQKMEALGVAIKPEWKESVRRACDGVVAVWKRYGQLGQHVKVDSGEIHSPNSTNGALVPGALALASKYFGNPAYMDAAKATGRYLYEHDLAKGYCGGGPAEILEAPDSESSCELGESYIALWELTGEKEWVEKAKAAAAMYASWVEAFDYPFPKTSRMGQLGIKATGSVWASVQNRHSAPGPYVMSADWLVKLSRATGDSRYAQVFYDTALNIAQYATTEKNRFMPKGDPGTLTERVNTCDWEGRRNIGGVLARDSNQAWENVALFTLMALEKNTLYRPREIDATWCSLGTSITWYNSNVYNARGRFTRAYQDRVLDVLRFKGFINRGVNGGVVASQHGKISKADYYTIEHGVNDWGHCVKVGTLADYENNASNKTFYANYRILIDQIRAINPQAKIIVCTPRKSYGFGRYLPPKETLPKGGIYLREYAEAVRAIAKKEGFALADFYANCGEEPELADLSIDVALHPNDPGYQRMADEIINAFGKAFEPK